MLSGFQDLKRLLEARDIPLLVDEQRQAIEIPTYIRNEQHRAVLLWDLRATLLLVIQPLLVEVPLDRELAMADALTRINHVLVLPGFGYDHERHAVYYRWVVPREPDGGMREEAVDQAVRTVLQSCRDFLPAIRAVAAGQTPSSEVVPFALAAQRAERGPQA